MLSLIWLLMQAPTQRPPAFPIEVREVYVDVFVTRQGRVVKGLDADSFELRDEGAVQAVELVPVQDLPLRTLLVLDTSGSLGRSRLEKLSQAASSLVARLGADDIVELMPFDQALRLAPVRQTATVAQLLARVAPWGGTALYDAIFAALVRAGSDRSLIVVFTDGEDNMSWLSGEQVVEAARLSSAVLHGVSLGRDHPPTREPGYLRDLRRVCQATGGHLWMARSAEDLEDTFAVILDAMQQRYLLRFEPGPKRPGWHRLEVRLRGARGNVRARPGYWQPP